MRPGRTVRGPNPESGIALLISIFILLLISVVAIALIVSSGTESALAGNYRASTSVYNAALAGLEEVRGRLLAKNPNAFQTTDPGFLPATLAVGNAYYVINDPAATPWDLASAYADKQFQQEFGVAPANPSPNVLSIWNRNPLSALPFPGPLYKWVRINAVSEQSLGLDVAPYDTTIDPNLVYYDGTNLNDTGTGAQALELTALAVLPNGSQKLLQALVTPNPMNLSFPAALTLDGDTPQFGASPSGSYYVKGIDQGSVGACNPGATLHDAVGYTYTSYSKSNFEQPGNSQGIPATLLNDYTNGVASNPDIALVTLSPNLTTVAGLNALVQTITQSADVVFNGDICVGGSCSIQTSMPAAMSASNPMTIVVNGDLTFNGWRSTGYGLLLVTGNMASTTTPAFKYDPDAFWNGIILVIGKGSMYSNQNSYTTTQIQGAVLLAKTVDSSNNPLPSASPPISSRFDFHSTPNTLSNGIYYSSCWIQAAMPSIGYKILSFHEIPQ